MKKISVLFLIMASFLITACAQKIGGNQYESSAVGQVNTASAGTIVSVRQVNVSTSDGTVGTVGGAVAGGALGSMIGGTTGANIAGAVGGAVLGGIIGQTAQGQLSSQTGFEYVVRLDNGNVVTVTQGTDVILAPGQRCLVLNASGGERARVIPYSEPAFQ